MNRHAAEYAALRAALGFFGVLPVGVASAIGGAVFSAIGPFMGVSRVARRNMAMCFPEWNARDIEQNLRLMWNNLGRVVAEYPHLEAIAKSSRVTFKNSDRLTELRDSGQAVVFVSGHIANWEVLPPALLFRSGFTMHSVYRAPNNPLVDGLLVRLRSFHGRLKSFGKNRRGLAETLRALENREAVGMLIDQKMNTGIESRFFGQPAMTSTAFVELSRKLGCPVVPGRIRRTGGCHFEIEIMPALKTEGRETAVVVAEMHDLLESWIREEPAQWLWLHRRWKKQGQEAAAV